MQRQEEWETEETGPEPAAVAANWTRSGLEGPWAYSGSNSLTVPADTASAADFSHIVEYTDLDANHESGDVSRTPPVGGAAIETYVRCLATDGAGSAEVLAGGVALCTIVYAVSCDTGSTGRSLVVVDTKSVLAELTAPSALALADEGRSSSLFPSVVWTWVPCRSEAA